VHPFGFIIRKLFLVFLLKVRLVFLAIASSPQLDYNTLFVPLSCSMPVQEFYEICVVTGLD